MGGMQKEISGWGGMERDGIKEWTYRMEDWLIDCTESQYCIRKSRCMMDGWN